MRRQIIFEYIIRFLMVYVIGFILLSTASSFAVQNPNQLNTYRTKSCSALLSRVEKMSKSIDNTILEIARIMGRPLSEVEVWFFDNLKIPLERLVSVRLISMTVHPGDSAHWEYKLSVKMLIHDPWPEARMRSFQIAGQNHKDYVFETSFLGPAPARNGLADDFAKIMEVELPNLSGPKKEYLMTRFKEAISDLVVFDGIVVNRMEVIGSNGGPGPWIDLSFFEKSGHRFTYRVGYW